MSFNSTVGVNQATFNQVNSRFLLELENTPDLQTNWCEFYTDQATSYTIRFQEKVNMTEYVPGNAPPSQSPEIREVNIGVKGYTARLSSNIFTQANVKENIIANFNADLREAMFRKRNQQIFDTISQAVTLGNILPTGHLLNTIDTPESFSTDTILRTGTILSREGASADVSRVITICNAVQQSYLLKDERYVSGFYNTQKPLPSGTIAQSPALGQTVMSVPDYPSQQANGTVNSGILPTATNTGGNKVILNFAMTNNALGCFQNLAPRMKTWYSDRDKTWYVDCDYQSGVEILRPNAIVAYWALQEPIS